MSNDGWFGWSEADRRQHVQMARWRCIENRVPMLRCVNTGLSVHLDSCGRVVATVGNGRYGEAAREGWIEAAMNLDDRSTVFSTMGWLWPWIVMALGIGVLGSTFFSKKNKGEQHGHTN
jgi:apolipoprotein N-acyltransferase